MEKFKDLLAGLFSRVPQTFPKASMRYITWYAFFLIFCASLYIVMIIADWHTSGKPDLSEFRQFIGVMLSGAAVAAIGFIAQWLVDTDNDGVPDEVENERQRKIN